MNIWTNGEYTARRPYTYYGKSDVDPQYFSSVIDDLDYVIVSLTGKSAHCHPSLYNNDK